MRTPLESIVLLQKVDWVLQLKWCFDGRPVASKRRTEGTCLGNKFEFICLFQVPIRDYALKKNKSISKKRLFWCCLRVGKHLRSGFCPWMVNWLCSYVINIWPSNKSKNTSFTVLTEMKTLKLTEEQNFPFFPIAGPCNYVWSQHGP